LTLDPPIAVELELAHAGQADNAAMIPGFVRVGDRGVRYEASDGIDAYRAFVTAIRVAPSADD
jgi:D-aminopeptidase